MEAGGETDQEEAAGDTERESGVGSSDGWILEPPEAPECGSSEAGEAATDLDIKGIAPEDEIVALSEGKAEGLQCNL